MGFAEAVIAFVVIGLPTLATFALVSRVLKHREKRMEIEARIAASNNAGTDKLEQRVRVLERIVTDRGIDVADEIERLRITEKN